MSIPNGFVIYVAEEERLEVAKVLANHLGVPLVVNRPNKESGTTLYLQYDSNGLALTDGDLLMRGDYEKMIPRLTHANLTHEMIVKAAKIKGSEGRGAVAVDATAGMGEDALLLAASGFDVYLYEYDPIIAALLRDTLERSSEVEGLKDVVSRMHFTEGDSISGMKNLGFTPDVVVLDPMFPARNKSALIKKKFQLLQQLESPCTDEIELFEAAKAANPHKIVIKRPAKGPYLAGVKPSYSMDGKAIRYDCILY